LERLGILSHPVDEVRGFPITVGDDEPIPGVLGFRVQAYRAGFVMFVPYWFLAFFGVCSIFAPWLHWRFSLRTLLIATTLIALVLGFAVYAMSQ
jgi:hypothetical protein